MLSHQVRRKVEHLRAVRDEFVLAVVAAHDQHLAEDLIKNKNKNDLAIQLREKEILLITRWSAALPLPGVAGAAVVADVDAARQGDAGAALLFYKLALS